MTVEGQRYLEECRKVLKEEQMDAVSMGLDFGLPVSDIQKVVKSNQEAPVMKAIIIGLMEGIGEIDFLCEGNYNQFQVREIVEGLKNGLDLEEVKTYAGNELPASRMRTMRIQLEESKAKKEVPKDEEMRSYMKNLMGIMEQSIQQFRESNDRFTALSSLVKEHVVEEKNQEIKDLYENLQYKDKNIQELKEKLAKKKQKVIDVKEVRMSPNIDTNDLNTKINHAKKFLAKGARVKVTLRFRGRELAHVNASKYILDDFAKALEDVATIDKKPKFEGRSMTMFLTEKR